MRVVVVRVEGSGQGLQANLALCGGLLCCSKAYLHPPHFPSFFFSFLLPLPPAHLPSLHLPTHAQVWRPLCRLSASTPTATTWKHCDPTTHKLPSPPTPSSPLHTLPSLRT